MTTSRKIEFNCCIIINCIRDTTDQLYLHLAYYDLVDLLQSHSIQVVTKEVETVDHFFKCLNEIHEKIIENNLNLWIHIFSHGNDIGFQFNHSNEILTWSQMANGFYKINKTLNYTLFLNLTCCKSINIKKMLETNKESFYEVIGCSCNLEVQHAQILNKTFYDKFLQGEKAENIINKNAKLWKKNENITVEYFNSKIH